MKDDELKAFFESHREPIEDDGFSLRLMNRFDYLPQPRKVQDRTPRIVGTFALLGFLLFVLAGGYGILLSGLSSIGGLFDGSGKFTPEIFTTGVILLLGFAALIRFSLRKASLF